MLKIYTTSNFAFRYPLTPASTGSSFGEFAEYRLREGFVDIFDANATNLIYAVKRPYYARLAVVSRPRRAATGGSPQQGPHRAGFCFWGIVTRVSHRHRYGSGGALGHRR